MVHPERVTRETSSSVMVTTGGLECIGIEVIASGNRIRGRILLSEKEVSRGLREEDHSPKNNLRRELVIKPKLEDRLLY